MQVQNGIKWNLVKQKIISQRQFLFNRRVSAKHEFRLSENRQSTVFKSNDLQCKIRRKSCYCSQCGEIGRFQQLTANIHISQKRKLRHNYSMETQVSPKFRTQPSKKSIFWRIYQQQTEKAETLIESQQVSRIDIQESLSNKNIFLPRIEIPQPISQRNNQASQQQLQYFHGYNQKFFNLQKKDEPLNQWIGQHSNHQIHKPSKPPTIITNYTNIIQKVHQKPGRKISKEETITRLFITPSLKLLSKHTKSRSRVVSP